MPEMPEVEIIRRIIERQIESYDRMVLHLKMTAQYLKIKLGKRKKSIKAMLHDQRIVAGIGNIYSDEILSAAGIYPEEKCMDLEDDDWSVLARKINEIIAWGIATNDMSPEEYLKPVCQRKRDDECFGNIKSSLPV